MDLKEAKEFNNKIGATRHPWELARFEVVYSLMRKHCNFIQKKDLIVLDIGCGDSFFLGSLALRLPAAKLIGVDTELDPLTITRYSKQYSNITFYNSFSDLETKNELADIVLLLDVLEHIEDDKGILENIVQNRITDNNTLFFITVPAFQWIFSHHDKWLGHYRRYDLESLSNVAERPDLKIINRGYFFFSLLFIRIMSSFFEKLTNCSFHNKGVAYWNAPAFWTKFVKTFLYLDYRVASFINQFGLKIPGLSCYVICQKQGL